MARAKRKLQRSTKVHDRRSNELPRNAEVAAVEVDDPLALEPGEKIVTLRSLRNDPLGRLHSHHQIDEAQYQGGRAFQDDWERAERGLQKGPAGGRASPSPSVSAKRCCGSTVPSANSAPTVQRWCMRCLCWD